MPQRRSDTEKTQRDFFSELLRLNSTLFFATNSQRHEGFQLNIFFSELHTPLHVTGELVRNASKPFVKQGIPIE